MTNKKRIKHTRHRQLLGTALSIGLVPLMLASGCKTIEPAALPQAKAVPERFLGEDTATNTGRISWRAFYKDEQLIALIDAALKNNPDILTGLQRILQTRAKAYMARAASMPTLNLVASASVDKYGDYTINGVGNYDTNLSGNIDDDQKVTNPALDLFLGLRSNWEIDIWGKLKARRMAAYNRYLASEQARRWFVTQVVAQVADRYYELIALDKQAAILNNNIQLQEKAVQIAGIQMDGGRSTALGVKQLQAQLLHTKSAAAEVKQQIGATENELNTIIGRFPVAIARNASILTYPLPETLSTGIPATALQDRPDIKAATLELAASQANVQAARKAFFPALTLTPYAGFNAFKGPLLFAPGSLVYGVLGGLSAPLFNQHQLKGQFAIANAAQTTSFYNYQKKVIEGYRDVLTQMQEIQNFRTAYEFKTAEVDNLTSAVRFANDLYVGGYANYLEIITAQRSVLAAELEQVGLKKRLLQGTTKLYRSLGGGWN